MKEYHPWDTFRTTCGRGRISYHPMWDQMRPWTAYVNGTATLHFATPEAAQLWFRMRHMMTLDIENLK